MDSFPHDSVNHDRLYSAADFREYFTPLVKNGVFANPANSCMVIASGDDRSVTVKKGRCFINGCIGYTDGTEKLTIPSSDPYYERYDLVVTRLDLESRDIHIELIKGTPSSAPEYPAIMRTSLKYDIALAAIKSSPTSYEITQGDITDLRQNDEYCGIVSGLININDTSDLFAQYEYIWQKFVEQLGENDHVTIVVRDDKARKMIKETRVRIGTSINVL